MTLVRLPVVRRRSFALAVLKRWGLKVKHRHAQPSFSTNEHQLHWLLFDGHKEWRKRHKEIRHCEESQKVLNNEWDLVKRSFRRRGINLYA